MAEAAPPASVTGLGPLDQRTTPAGVVRVLRDAILNGTFPPGRQLREAILAADLGISRAPLREAFSRLEEEGLLRRVAFRGAFVAEVSAQTVAEIADLRFLVEPYAAEQTAQRLGKQMPKELNELVRTLRTAADAADVSATIEAHLAFHRFFYVHSSNDLLAGMWRDWETRLRLFLAVDHQQYENLDDLATGHEHLAELVRAGHMELFRGELAHHVHRSPGAPLRHP